MKNKVKELSTDSVAVSDTIWIARGRPAVAYGLRGLAPVRLVLETGTKDVHSGVTGGGARNPITELCQLIAECYDVRKGHIRIPGFYDDVAKLSKAEMENFIASGFSVKEFKQAHELKKMREGDAADIAARLWARPTLEVHGIVGGYTGPGPQTITCVKCKRDFEVNVPDKIIAGPFPFPPGFENLQ